jgi:hypothetical protein
MRRNQQTHTDPGTARQGSVNTDLRKKIYHFSNNQEDIAYNVTVFF